MWTMVQLHLECHGEEREREKAIYVCVSAVAAVTVVNAAAAAVDGVEPL